jgi:hypothetical protein
MPSEVSRRRLLAAVGGVAGTATFGYAGARVAARRGGVVVRHVAGETRDDGGTSDSVELFHAEVDPDGPAERRFHPDYRDAFSEASPITVSPSGHRELEEGFDRVRYHLGHDCPDADCSTPRVSRSDFNDAALGSEVRLLYHSHPWATVVP